MKGGREERRERGEREGEEGGKQKIKLSNLHVDPQRDLRRNVESCFVCVLLSMIDW